MEIIELARKPEIKRNIRLRKRLMNLRKLIYELNKKDLPFDVLESINEKIEEINLFTGSEKFLDFKVRKALRHIFKLVESNLKIVPKSYYRTRWIFLGMTIIGIPLGLIIGLVIGKMVYAGLGIPAGMVIGLFIGETKDKKALAEGRQLDLEL
nr:hypothetical protein [uncultured Carboxylicivirga sp.]